MSQLPLSCAKTSLPAPGGMRFLSLLPHRLTFKVLRVGSCGAASHFSFSWEGMSQTPLHPAGLPPCIDGGGSFILSLWDVFLFPHLKSPLVWLGFITSKEDPPISIPGEKIQGKLESLQTCTGGGQPAWGGGIRWHREEGAGGYPVK